YSTLRLLYSIFCSLYRPQRVLHSFPTRRSSDLCQPFSRQANVSLDSIRVDEAAADFGFSARIPCVGLRVPDGQSCGIVFARSRGDRKSTRLNSSHVKISYAVFCLKKKKI